MLQGWLSRSAACRVVQHFGQVVPGDIYRGLPPVTRIGPQEFGLDNHALRLLFDFLGTVRSLCDAYVMPIRCTAWLGAVGWYAASGCPLPCEYATQRRAWLCLPRAGLPVPLQVPHPDAVEGGPPKSALPYEPLTWQLACILHSTEECR